MKLPSIVQLVILKKSPCCNHVIKTNSFTSVVTQKTYEIFHNSNCRSMNVTCLNASAVTNNLSENLNGPSITD